MVVVVVIVQEEGRRGEDEDGHGGRSRNDVRGRARQGQLIKPDGIQKREGAHQIRITDIAAETKALALRFNLTNSFSSFSYMLAILRSLTHMTECMRNILEDTASNVYSLCVLDVDARYVCVLHANHSHTCITYAKPTLNRKLGDPIAKTAFMNSAYNTQAPKTSP